MIYKIIKIYDIIISQSLVNHFWRARAWAGSPVPGPTVQGQGLPGPRVPPRAKKMID